jgi:hypothetical protein
MEGNPLNLNKVNEMYTEELMSFAVHVKIIDQESVMSRSYIV